VTFSTRGAEQRKRKNTRQSKVLWADRIEGFFKPGRGAGGTVSPEVYGEKKKGKNQKRGPKTRNSRSRGRRHVALITKGVLEKLTCRCSRKAFGKEGGIKRLKGSYRIGGGDEKRTRFICTKLSITRLKAMQWQREGWGEQGVLTSSCGVGVIEKNQRSDSKTDGVMKKTSKESCERGDTNMSHGLEGGQQKKRKDSMKWRQEKDASKRKGKLKKRNSKISGGMAVISEKGEERERSNLEKRGKAGGGGGGPF